MASNSSLRLVGLDLHESGGGAALKFDLIDDYAELVGTFRLDVAPTEIETTDSMIAAGYRQMSARLTHWAKRFDQIAANLEGR